MPNYDYHCEKCGKDFEAFQSMKDASYTTCPKEKCQMETWGEGIVKRQIGTGAGLIFKGSGFYITDYRSDSYKQGAKKDAGSTPGTGGESKPAAPKAETPKATPPKPASGGQA